MFRAKTLKFVLRSVSELEFLMTLFKVLKIYAFKIHIREVKHEVYGKRQK